MDNNPGLFGLDTGDLGNSFKVQFPPADVTLISAIEDGAPNSATYTTPPVPVVFSKAKAPRYDHSVT